MKTLAYISAILLVLGAIGIAICKYLDKDDSKAEGNTTVEALIKQDKAYFDNMAGKIIFYESQITLDKPFNEGEKLVAVEVTNVFQQILDTTSNVYEFKHIINYGDIDVQIHKNTSWLEDRPVYTDSLTLTFDHAYNRAKQSDLIPTKSRFMTLRNPLGRNLCNPQYIIGNDSYGIMFVDGVTGDVSDKNPAFK